MAHETARARRALASDAGLPTTSAVSVIAGMLVAFGAVGVVLAIVGAIGNQLGLTTNGTSTQEWRNLGIAGAAVATIVLLGAFWFGGYTAGRMSRRAGMRQGLVVFLLAVVTIAVVIGLTAWAGGTDVVRDRLADNGVPTDADTWSGIAIGATLAGLAAMLVGALAGGMQGDRWHGRIEQLAADKRAATVDVDEHVEERPRRALGDDPTTQAIDLTAAERERSVAQELEDRQRAREDVGM